MPINGCTDVVALLCHTPFDLLLPPIQCCCLCASSHAKNRKEREKKINIKSKARPRLSIVFHFLFSASSPSNSCSIKHDDDYPVPTFARRVFYSVIEVLPQGGVSSLALFF